MADGRRATRPLWLAKDTMVKGDTCTMQINIGDIIHIISKMKHNLLFVLNIVNSRKVRR